jgi:hypothetical protein
MYESSMNLIELDDTIAEQLNKYFQFQLIPDKIYLIRTKDNEKICRQVSSNLLMKLNMK